MLFDMVPDYAVDIPLIWQYIGEILGKISSTLQETCRHSFAVGAFIGAPSSNMFLLKSIVQYAPQDKATCLFQYIIRYAAEFSVGTMPSLTHRHIISSPPFSRKLVCRAIGNNPVYPSTMSCKLTSSIPRSNANTNG